MSAFRWMKQLRKNERGNVLVLGAASMPEHLAHFFGDALGAGITKTFLWLGPAAKTPFNVNRFHYNWHWHWAYGNGDTGNQGPHQFDIARWGLGVKYPTKVMAIGHSNDVRLYRELLKRGVSEYLVAPVDVMAVITVISAERVATLRGLPISVIAEVRAETGLPIVTEVMDTPDELFARAEALACTNGLFISIVVGAQATSISPFSSGGSASPGWNASASEIAC